MAVSPITDAVALSQVQAAAGLIENSPWNCQISRIWPFMGIDGYGIQYSAIDQIEVDYGIDDTSPARILGDSTPTVPDNTSNVDLINTFLLGELGTQYLIPYSQMDRVVFPNKLDTVEGALAEIRLKLKHFSMIGIAGSTADGDFLGLPSLCASNRIVDFISGAPGSPPGPLTAAGLDEAFFAVTAGPGRPNYIMSHSRAIRTALQVLRSATLNDPESMRPVEIDLPDPMRGTVRTRVPAWRGVPWLTNDLIPIASDGTDDANTPIFFMLVGESGQNDGNRGITGIIPRERVGNMFVHRPANNPGSTPEYAMTCTWPVGLAVPTQGALSMAVNFQLVPNLITPPAV